MGANVIINKRVPSPDLRERKINFVGQMGREFCKLKTGFTESQAGRQCKGRQPRNFDFLQLMMLIAHWVDNYLGYSSDCLDWQKIAE